MADVGEKPAGTVAVPPDELGERVLIQSALPQGQGPPSRVLVAPWGEVKSAKGTFVVDGESAKLVIEAFRAHGTDIPVDYEHQSLGGEYASPSGQAPAAGWIRALSVVEPGEAAEEPGLFADVEWTEAARKRLSAKEYRYLSPVVLVRKSDRRMVALHSAALTNKPAIVGMKAIVNNEVSRAADPGEGQSSPHCLSAEADALRRRLGLPEDSDSREILIAAEARLASLAAESVRRGAEERVVEAMRTGKLTQAQRQWALSLAMKHPETFEEWLKTAPVLVVPGRINPPAGEDTANQRRWAVIASARAEFRSRPELALITSEQAWIRNALRDAGLELSED
ncbi:MAG TPA: phage protease [Phycisphaerae bacterium]|nr:phage protease [Phycisphaerae bacterium]HRR86883.1 phage protease [Phycisphaerae bacterium]